MLILMFVSLLACRVQMLVFRDFLAVESISPGRSARSAVPIRGLRWFEEMEGSVMHGDLSQYTGEAAGEFELDMKIVEHGPVAAALLGNTDDGCDTRRDGDC